MGFKHTQSQVRSNKGILKLYIYYTHVSFYCILYDRLSCFNVPDIRDFSDPFHVNEIITSIILLFIMTS